MKSRFHCSSSSIPAF